MGRYYTNSKAFNGYIMAEFKFNLLEVFSQHFKVHNSVVISFKHNEIVIQTKSETKSEIMCEKTMKGDDTDIKSFYTTTIPSESLEEYEYDCNIPEVNVIVTKSLIKNTSKVDGGCKHINVVSNGFLLINEEIIEPLLEISIDLYEKDNRRRRKELREKIADSNFECTSNVENSKSDEIFGKIVRCPYLHYLIISRIDYKVHRLHHRLNDSYKSILVRSPKVFKSQFGTESRIFIIENGTILFCNCHHYSEGDTIIQQPNNECKNYDMGEEEYEMLDYELPSKVFIYLYRFITQIGNKSKDVVNNFEMLIRRCETPIEEKTEEFKVGDISFNKLIPSSVKRKLDNDKMRKRREMLERNFDKRNDWSNIKTKLPRIK